jgi:hypothetical protein
MNTNRSLFGLVCRAAAFCFLVAGSASLIEAQTSPAVTFAPRAPLFLASESSPMNLAGTSSSSSSSDADASYTRMNLDSPAAPESPQPPPRRSYGRPNYSSGNTNPDGSDKWFFLGGFGASSPIGITHKYETVSYGFQVGGGRNFNKNVGVGLQFDYDHFGLQAATINNQAYIYNYCTVADYEAEYCAPEGAGQAESVSGLDGNNHVWSFTLNPTYTVATDGSLGAYAVIGAGFYHKVTNFTEPETEEECYYFCEEVEANANIDHYTSNAFGISPGFGVTYKFSHFSSERFYVEVRYVLTFNSQRAGVTAANVATSSLSATDFYPANSDRTTYIPIKVGLRF